MTAKTIETVCIGIISSEIGYCQAEKVIKAGERVFEFIGELTYAEFTKVKKEFKLNQSKPNQ